MTIGLVDERIERVKSQFRSALADEETGFFKFTLIDYSLRWHSWIGALLAPAGALLFVPLEAHAAVRAGATVSTHGIVYKARFLAAFSADEEEFHSLAATMPGTPIGVTAFGEFTSTMPVQSVVDFIDECRRARKRFSPDDETHNFKTIHSEGTLDETRAAYGLSERDRFALWSDSARRAGCKSVLLLIYGADTAAPAATATNE